MVVGEFTQDADLLVIGGGPGGYHAAFRAASHGIATTIVESLPSLGGVCLHRGCIPSKTYLALAEMMHAASTGEAMGIHFGKPKLDVNGIRGWKEKVVTQLASGLDGLCKKNKVDKVQGTVRFEDEKHVRIEGAEVSRIKFRRAIIATGSRSAELRGIQIDSPRVLTSCTALDLKDIPKKILQGIEIVEVTHMDQVLRHALESHSTLAGSKGTKAKQLPPVPSEKETDTPPLHA